METFLVAVRRGRDGEARREEAAVASGRLGSAGNAAAAEEEMENCESCHASQMKHQWGMQFSALHTGDWEMCSPAPQYPVKIELTALLGGNKGPFYMAGPVCMFPLPVLYLFIY